MPVCPSCRTILTGLPDGSGHGDACHGSTCTPLTRMPARREPPTLLDRVIWAYQRRGYRLVHRGAQIARLLSASNVATSVEVDASGAIQMYEHGQRVRQRRVDEFVQIAFGKPVPPISPVRLRRRTATRWGNRLPSAGIAALVRDWMGGFPGAWRHPAGSAPVPPSILDRRGEGMRKDVRRWRKGREL